MSKSAKHIRISEYTHTRLLRAKKDFKFSSIDDVIAYLFDAKKDILSNNQTVEFKEKYILNIEENIYKRLESTHKRLGQFEKSYFRKIIDSSNILEQFNQNVLKIVNGDIDKTASDQSDYYKEKFKEFKENIRMAENKAYAAEKEVRDLKQKIERIKNEFKLNNRMYIKSYDASFKPEIFEQIFK
ncbi:hypothetical protein ACFQH0_03740 [Frigoriflavimonas asaccharolytica]